MTSNRIIFSPQYKSDFINELRAKVNEYFESNKISKYGNTNMLVKTLFMILLYITPLALMLLGFVSTLPFLLFCWVLMGVGMAGVGMATMHDANHGVYSENKIVNSLLSKSLYFLGGYPITWQYQHNTLHHGFTNIEGHDEDIAPIGLLRFSPHKPLLKVHKFQHFYAWFFYGLMTISWITAKDFRQLAHYKNIGAKLASNKSYRTMFTELIAWKLVYYTLFLVLPLIFISVSWYWIVLGFIVMHFICGFLLGIIFQTAHVMPSSVYPLPDENGNMVNNWAIHQLQTTSDYSPKSRLFSWLIGGLNYQVEHHLFPNISHVHYHRISFMVKETAQKYGLPYHVQPTFYAALLSHGIMLKKLGRMV